MDYPPFGMAMPGRQYAAGSGYRYGFNGKELDDKDGVVQYDYGFRIYDPRLGRFKSVDPLFKSFPWYTPYQYAGNKPIACIDLDGLEETGFTMMLDRKLSTSAGAHKMHQDNKPLQKPAVVVATALTIATIGWIAPEAVPYIWRGGMYLANPVNQQVILGSGTVAAGLLDPNPLGAPTVDLPGPGDEVGRVIKASTKKLFSSVKPIIEKRKDLAKTWGIASKYIEFGKKVFTKEIEEGTELIQYRVAGNEGTIGNYFALPGTKPEEIGIKLDDVVETLTLKVKKGTNALFSTHKKDLPYYKDGTTVLEGGGQQIYSKDLRNNVEITDKKVTNGANGSN